MNTTPTRADAPDDLDRLLSEFFKAQLKQPWPNAPLPAAAAEPSELAAARAAEPPRSAPARRDSSARARFTLAASVALMLGTCWYLSNGFAPGPRPAAPNPGNRPGLLPDSGASGEGHLPLETIKEDRAKGNNGPAKIDADKFE